MPTSRAKKTATQKLHESHGLPKVEKLTGKMAQRYGEVLLLVPAPAQVDALMKKVPKGKLTTVNQLRQTLAADHGADMACAIVTGISTVLSANAAEEEKALGAKRVTPWWRTLKSKGELNPKYPGGEAAQAALLAAEGFTVEAKGKTRRVKDFEKFLIKG